MKGEGRRNLWVGALLLTAFLIFLFFIVAIGQEEQLWTRKLAYKVRFPETFGLMVGAPVRLAGVPIGSVRDISFPENPDDFSVIVTLEVDRKVRSRIRRDTRATIATEGILGDALIQLQGGSAQSPVQPPGSFLDVELGASFDALRNTGGRIAENILSISESLKVIFGRIEGGEGLLARLLNDPAYGDDLARNLLDATQRTNAVLGAIQEGEGLAGRLLMDRDYGEKVSGDLEEATGHLRAVLQRIDEGQGLAGQLTRDDPDSADLVANLAKFTRALATLSADLEQGRGLLGRLASDDETAREILSNLRTTTAHLNSIVAKVDSGEGTVGMLIEDPSVYESMSNILGGMERSRVLRWFVRREQAKGLNVEAEAAAREAPAVSPGEQEAR